MTKERNVSDTLQGMKRRLRCTNVHTCIYLFFGFWTKVSDKKEREIAAAMTCVSIERA